MLSGSEYQSSFTASEMVERQVGKGGWKPGAPKKTREMADTPYLPRCDLRYLIWYRKMTSQSSRHKSMYLCSSCEM
jgi:hypothetical protein